MQNNNGLKIKFKLKLKAKLKIKKKAHPGFSRKLHADESGMPLYAGWDSNPHALSGTRS